MTGAAFGNYMSIFGGILDAIGSVYSGYQQNSISKYNAKVSEAQAGLVDANIRYRNTITESNIKLRTQTAQKQMRILEGQQTAGYAASGVRMTGSPIDVIVNSRANMELDLALTNLNDKMITNQQNITDTISAQGYKSQAQIERAQGLQAISKGFAGATKSLISTAINYKSPSNVLGSDTIGGSSLYNKYGSEFKIGSRRW